MQRIVVQSDGSPIEIIVFDGDEQVARHVVRSIGRSGELVLCMGGPDRGAEAPRSERDESWGLPD